MQKVSTKYEREVTKRAKLTAQLKYEAERVAQRTRQQEERERYVSRTRIR